MAASSTDGVFKYAKAKVKAGKNCSNHVVQFSWCWNYKFSFWKMTSAILRETIYNKSSLQAEPTVDLLTLQHQLWNSLAMHVPPTASGEASAAPQFWDAVATQFQPRSAAAMPGSDAGLAMQGQQWYAAQSNDQEQGEAAAASHAWEAAAWEAAAWGAQDPDPYTQEEWDLWSTMSRRQRFRAQFGYEKPRGGKWQAFYGRQYGRSSKPWAEDGSEKMNLGWVGKIQSGE